MIISIAMLGIGASGTVLSLYPKLRRLPNISIYSLLLGISISLSYLLANQIPFDPVRLSWEKAQLLYISLYYITLSTPFFFTGLIISTAFSSMSERSGLIYGSDLLGAGIGSIGILYLMTITAPEKAVFILSSIALTASFIISGKRLKIISLVLILLNISILLFQPRFIDLRMSPYKGLQVALRYPGGKHLKTYLSPFSRIDIFESPAVRFAPGLSLKYLDALPEQIGFSIDGGEINAVTVRKGDKVPLAKSPLMKFVGYMPSALPYEMGNPPESPHTPLWKRGAEGDFKEGMGGLDNVLILDPKGGLQVLIATYYGSKNIYKIESNPLLIKIIRDEFKDFSGDIYRDNTWPGLGRSWLKLGNPPIPPLAKGGEGGFDIIDIPLTGTMPSGSFGIAEDYRFTVEAFREYINHLKPDGLLSINLFILPPPRIELRLINTIIAAMEELGIKGIEKHIVAIRSWGNICMLVKKSPFTSNEIEAVKKFSRDKRFDLIHYPGIKEEETNIYVKMPSNEYFAAFKNILNPEARKEFINNYIFDIRPVHDENPFFHYYLKLKNIKEIYKIMGEKWQYFIEEGYILPVVFIQVLFLGLVLIVLPAFSRKQKNNNDRGRGFLPYFAFLGIGFMFVEISLIQKIILPLENPSYAVAVVLTSILISSGIGSLLSYRSKWLKSSYVAIVISFLIILYSMLLPAISDVISPYHMPIKIILVFFILMPLGLLMGIPFPTGLKILGERNELLIPWAWAINGCLSVLAPIMTIMLAMAMGFKVVLWLGAVAYIIAFIVLKNPSLAEG
jgi:hypothetical protein